MASSAVERELNDRRQHLVVRPSSGRVATSGGRSRWIILSVAVAGALAFAAFQLRQATVGPPVIFPDSHVYARIAAAPIISRTFLAGGHPPLTSFVWKLSGNAATFVVVQTCISVLAWLALAWSVGRLVGRRWLGLGAAAVVLGFASTGPVMQWNGVALSESLSLSALALFFATGIWWVQKPTILRAVALIVVAAMFALARDSDLWVVALLAVALAAYAALRRATVPRVAWVAIAGLGIVTALTFTASMASHRFDFNLRNIVAARVLPYHDRVVWWADHGMPQARQIEAAGRKHPCDCDDATVVSWKIWQESRFDELTTWLHRNGARVYLEWMLTHPDYVLTEPFRRPERVAINGHLSDYAPKGAAPTPLLTSVLYPPWPIVAACGAGVIVAIVRRRDRRRVVLFLTLLGALGLVHMLIAWHGDGMEALRHALIGNAQTRLAILLLALLLILGWIERRRATKSTAHADGAPVSDVGPNEPAEVHIESAELPVAAVTDEAP